MCVFAVRVRPLPKVNRNFLRSSILSINSEQKTQQTQEVSHNQHQQKETTIQQTKTPECRTSHERKSVVTSLFAFADGFGGKIALSASLIGFLPLSVRGFGKTRVMRHRLRSVCNCVIKP